MNPPCVTIPVTIPCPTCGRSFAPSGRRRYCSGACRQAAYRHRTTTPPASTPPTKTPQADTVYQCPSCEARYLGQRRCPECNLFCRRLGPGGPCPTCDEPVAITDLIPEVTNQPEETP